MKSKNCCLALTLVLPWLIFTLGCNRANQTDSSPASNVNSIPDTNATMSASTNSMTQAADNSGINVRDRDTNNLTAGDQGNSAADIELTQKIRKSLMMDTNYSTTAKNVKIITANGNVTLRGPVNSESEKSGIATLTKNLAGNGEVNNQLEVKANP